MNSLAQSTSPYLLQHKDNPVHWHQWGPEALAEAERTNKPILLSVGYAACHWCHVMAHESFENEATAALMNKLFVNIKVDREERPDIDAIYQTVLNMMGEQGGWPLTVFLTPKGEAFWGGTYFPPEPKFGRPAFQEALKEVSRLYNENGEQVAKNTQTLRTGLAQLFEANRAGQQLDPQTLDSAMKRLCQQFDVFAGGLLGAPKFPNTPVIELMWRAYQNTSAPQFLQAVEMTLINMCQGGIYDHLGGGFSRYSVDDRWLVPHFEKMLYDNAQLIDVLTLVWLNRRNPIYRSRIEETATWALREMLTEGGAFASSIDADSEGEEGKFYVWTEEEIDQALGKDAGLFKQVYDVRPNGNWEGRAILHRLRAPAPLQPIEEGKLNGLREKLFLRREKRVKPGRDDKVLADWNGLMIYALANASDAFGRVDWQAAAVKAFWYVADKMGKDLGGDGNTLAHSSRAGKVGTPGLAEDYANMTRAALALYEITGHQPYFERAQGWVKTLNDRFWRMDIGGYTLTPADGDPLITRVRTVLDGATPSVNGTMMHVLGRMEALTGDVVHSERFSVLTQAFAEDARRQLIPSATYLNGFDFILRAMQVVIIGQRNDPGVIAFRDVLKRLSLPNKVVTIIPPGEALHERNLAYGKGQVGGKATVYLCAAHSCSAPVTDPNHLELALKTRFVDGQQPIARG